jgi:hypothetical protein
MIYFPHYEKQKEGWKAFLYWYIDSVRHVCYIGYTKYLEDIKSLLDEEKRQRTNVVRNRN